MTKRMTDEELFDYLSGEWVTGVRTFEQIDRIIDDYRNWERNNPQADSQDADAMLTAICQLHDGTINLQELAEADLKAQQAAADARRALKAASIVLHQHTHASERAIALTAGVDRGTLRNWLGKDK